MPDTVQRNTIYKDLDLDLDIHPNTKSLNKLVGDVAIARSLKNLILTGHYERKFHPEIGCNIRQSLFDNIQQSTADTIRNSIVEVVQNFEPRVEISNVIVTASPDENGYNVILEYFIVNESTPKRTGFFLERIR